MRFLPRKRAGGIRRNRLTTVFYFTLLRIFISSVLLFSSIFMVATLWSFSLPPTTRIHATGGRTRFDSEVPQCECNQSQTCSTSLPIGSFTAPNVSGVIGSFLSPAALENEKRRLLIRTVAMSAWDAYVNGAWGYDELRPISGMGNNVNGGMAATILEAIPTLYIMRLQTRYEAARGWVLSYLDFDSIADYVSVHEVTTRILGSLMSAYHLTGDKLFLQRAEELGKRLSPAFNSMNGIPFPFCRLSRFRNMHSTISKPVCKGRTTSQSAAGGLSLEFRALSYHSILPSVRRLRCKVERAVQAVVEGGPNILVEEVTDELMQNKTGNMGTAFSPWLERQSNPGGILRSISFNFLNMYNANIVNMWQKVLTTMRTGPTLEAAVKFSASSRCFYEYLMKAWRQGGRCEDTMKYTAGASMRMLLIRAIDQSPTDDFYLRRFDISHNTTEAVLERAICYLPALLQVAAMRKGISSLQEEHLREVSEGITDSCINMYYKFSPQLGGTSATYNGTVWVTKGAYKLQGDLLEALFYMWRATEDNKYREEAWKTFLRITRECAVDTGAFTILVESTIGNVTRGDRMPSWFLGSTMRFLYLTFAKKETLSSEHWIFNSAGHPLLVTPGIGTLNPCQAKA